MTAVLWRCAGCGRSGVVLAADGLVLTSVVAGHRRRSPHCHAAFGRIALEVLRPEHGGKPRPVSPDR